MWMMATHQISTFINSQTTKRHLVGIRDSFCFISPVEDHDNKFCTVLFDFGNIVFQLLFPSKVIVQFIDSHKTDLDAFYIHDCCIIISKMCNSCVIKSCHGIGIALVAVIMAVVIGGIYRFYRTAVKDLGIFSRSFKCECFVLAGIGICKCSLEISDGQVIGLEDAFYIFEEIIFSVIIIISSKTGIIIKSFISSKCTVADYADGKRNRFFSCFSCGRFCLGFFCFGFCLGFLECCCLGCLSGRAGACGKDDDQKQYQKNATSCKHHFLAADLLIAGVVGNRFSAGCCRIM